MYILDTNICIYAMKGIYTSLNEKLLSIPTKNIFISTVTIGELEYGAKKSKWQEHSKAIMQAFLSHYDIIPFTAADAICFGNIKAELELKGLPIGSFDAMIGAQGVVRNFSVITHNLKEFKRIPNLILEDWVL
ncbi:MAG: type II toxin-antitoxin system VapC family toxin [Selenomonadaceae bacterium]|nr:type II toxin-antitoxin system VapC family toxin [Selenomonadaceae bacterium]